MADFDSGAQMQALLAANSLRQASQMGPGDKGWAFKPMNQGANSVAIGALGPLKGNPPSFTGTGNGMFGRSGPKLQETLAAIGEKFLESIKGPTGIQAPSVGGDVFSGSGLPRNLGGGSDSGGPMLG